MSAITHGTRVLARSAARHRPYFRALGGGGQALLIRFKDPAKVAASSGGAAAAVASLIPHVPGGTGALSGLVYDGARKEFAGQLQQRGIDADVSVVADSPGGPSRSGVGFGVLIGAAVVGVAWGIKALFGKR
jgi:hypothetical protein